MLYSMVRTPEREALFQWVGPIGKMTLGIIAKKSTQMKVTTLESLRQYKIAMIPDTASEKALIDMGLRVEYFERFSNRTSQLKNFKKIVLMPLPLVLKQPFLCLKKWAAMFLNTKLFMCLKRVTLLHLVKTPVQKLFLLNETLKTLTK